MEAPDRCPDEQLQHQTGPRSECWVILSLLSKDYFIENQQVVRRNLDLKMLSSTLLDYRKKIINEFNLTLYHKLV